MAKRRVKQRRAGQAATTVAARRDGSGGGDGDGGRLRRVAATFCTAAALSALYVGYHVLTRSLQVVPTRARPRPVGLSALPTIGQRPEERKAKRILARYPWVAKAKTSGRTTDKQTTYYFNEWKQESKTVISFRPFVLVSTPKDAKPGDPPYVVGSDAASIQFASEVNSVGINGSAPPAPSGNPVAAGNPGAIVRANLEGNVTIDGPNQLHIEGKNFFFQKGDHVVFTDNFVKFQADGHFGTAKGMFLELIPNETAKPDEPLAIGGVRSVKLTQDVNLTLAADALPQDVLPAAAPAAAPGATKTAKKPMFVHCHSAGSFTFVLAAHEATFERDVRISRETSPGKHDYLAADESVRIVFEPKDGPNAHAPAGARTNSRPSVSAAGQPDHEVASAQRSSGGLNLNLQFKELHAEGKRNVTLVSEENGLRAVMRHLDYDRKKGEAKLAAAPGRVRVEHGDDLLMAPFIQLNHDESGRQITEVWCQGEGLMRHVDEKSKQVDFAADWKKQMHKHRDPRSSFDLIELEERAIIEQPNEASGIAADLIDAYLVPPETDRRVARSNRAPARPRANPSGGNAPVVDHLIAIQRTEKVAMISRQLEAEAKRLEIWFHDGPLAAPRADPRGRRARANLVPTSKRVETGGRESGPPDQGPAPTTAGPARAGKQSLPGMGLGGIEPMGGKDAEPYVMKADLIIAHIIRGAPGEASQVSRVECEGDVHLKQAQKDAEPLAVDGSTLSIENHGGQNQEMIVHGQPAIVRNRGALIEGSRIDFDRAKNTALVNKAGRLQLPSKPAAGVESAGPSLPMDVSWLDKMRFDGTTARFLGTVHCKMDDGHEKIDVRCHEMSVQLNKRFSFTDEHRPGEKRDGEKPDSETREGEKQDDEQPEVKTIDCFGGVEFESDSRVDDQLVEVRRGRFRQLHFDRQTGKSQSDGPLTLRVWRRSQNGQSGLPQFANVRSNSPPKARKNLAWEYTQINSGLMHGDFLQMLSQRQTAAKPKSDVRTASATSALLGPGGEWGATFRINVEVIYGPVDEPMVTVSRDDLQDRCGCMRCDTLFVEQHPESQTETQKVTLFARDNASIEGKEFFGEAETISYDSSTGYYILRGGNHGLAKIVRQLKVGSEQSAVPAVTMKFKPETNELILDQAVSLDGVR